jgi:hypothetical protein
MDYQGYHRQLLQQLTEHILASAPFNGESFSEDDHAFMSKLKNLAQQDQDSEAFYQAGQEVLCQIIACYPHITPAISRDLLWFFGGDCMHFLSDEEIDMYSELDELRFEAQRLGASFDILEAKQKIRKLH